MSGPGLVSHCFFVRAVTDIVPFPCQISCRFTGTLAYRMAVCRAPAVLTFVPTRFDPASIESPDVPARPFKRAIGLVDWHTAVICVRRCDTTGP